MLNKRKIVLMAVVAAISVLLITVLIIYALRSGQPVQSSDAPTPSPTFDEQEAATEAFSEHEQTARDAAAAACSWSMLTSDAIAQTQYEAAGFTESLAATYSPVWAQLFDPATVASAEIDCDVTDPPSINAVEGAPGQYVWHVSVRMTFGGTYVENASPGAVPPGNATWILTLEEASGDVIAIEQPEPDQLEIPTEEP